MATWELTSEYKKSVVERQFWFKDSKVIIREEGYRWGTFTVESDDIPLTPEELRNEDGYELGCIDNDNSWELVDMIDGCWADAEAGVNCTDEDLEKFEEAWEENYYEGVEELGWMQDDTEYFFTSGALKLTNLDTGKEYSGLIDPATVVHTIELPVEQSVAETTTGAKWPFATAPLVKEEPELTEWFPVEINPVRVGFYDIQTKESINFPNPNKGEWDGKKWHFLDHTVTFWRGLAKDPGAK